MLPRKIPVMMRSSTKPLSAPFLTLPYYILMNKILERNVVLKNKSLQFKVLASISSVFEAVGLNNQ